MLRRAFLGLFEGLVIGIGLGALSARLGFATPGSIIAALLAGAAGFLVGLVAGRPVWARAAKTEALLKAGIGSLVGATLSVALGHWLTLRVDLAAYGLGSGAAGGLSVVFLPAIACALALCFELDNAIDSGPPARLSEAVPKPRLAASDRNELNELNKLNELNELNELGARGDDAERKTKKR